MTGSVSTMIVSRSRDKEAYLKEAYDNVRSMALQDLNPFKALCYTDCRYHQDHWSSFCPIIIFFCYFVKPYKGLLSRWALCQQSAGSHFF